MLVQLEAVVIAAGLTLQTLVSRHGVPAWYPSILTLAVLAAVVVVVGAAARLWLRQADRHGARLPRPLLDLVEVQS